VKTSEISIENAFTQLVGCRHPLQQAAMGGVAVPELAGAVAGAGALGMLCEFGIEAAADRMTRALHLAGGGALGMGFFGRCIDTDLGNFASNSSSDSITAWAGSAAITASQV
jgi:hypothetical protein